MGFHQEKNSHGHTVWVKDGEEQEQAEHDQHVLIMEMSEQLIQAGIEAALLEDEIRELRQRLAQADFERSLRSDWPQPPEPPEHEWPETD